MRNTARPGTSRRMRRTIAVTLAAVLASSLAACGSDSADSASGLGADCNIDDVVVDADGTATAPEECQFDGQTLKVAAYTGAMTDALKKGVGKLVEEATGAKIEWVGIDNATAISQILASKGTEPPFDVASAMTTVDLQSLVKSDALLKPDDLDPYTDFPEQAFGVEGYPPGFYYYVTGMCVRSDKFEEAGLDASQGIEVLKDPKLAGKVAFPNGGITQWDGFIPALNAHLGGSMDDPSTAIDWLSGIEGMKFWASSGDLDQWFMDGDVWAGPASDGRCLALQEQGVPVEYVSLKMDIDGSTWDAVGETTGAYVVDGTNLDVLGQIYIKLINQPAGLMPYLTDRAIYLPTNPDTFAELEKVDPNKAALLTGDPSKFYQPDYDSFLDHRQDWLDQWNRAFQS